MAIEIERKYLVNKEKWEKLIKPNAQSIRQGYLSTNPNLTIRVRIAVSQSFITIKGKAKGISRAEFEYEIPLKDAFQLFDEFVKTEISKNRYLIEFKNHTWEIDEFLGDNKGLIIAEIELKDENESFELPDWIEKEVTGESKYYNSNLVLMPFKKWNLI